MASPPFPSGAALTQSWDPSIGEYGDDFGLAPGTPILAPDLGPGIITAEESRGKSMWGRRIQETFLSGPFKGWSFDVGHLTSFAEPTGSIVQPGQLLGYSGGALNDPQSGNTTGPHIEPQLQDPSGRYHNPLDFLQSLLSGRAPAVPNDQGVVGPAFVGQGGAGRNDFTRERGSGVFNFGSSGQGLVNIDINPFRGLGDWLSKEGHSLENFVVANVIALVVAALILLVLFGGSDSPRSQSKPKPVVVPV